MGLSDKIFGSARDRFGKEVAARIRAHDLIAQADYDPEQFQVVYQRRDDGTRGQVLLANTFRECEGASPEDRRTRIDKLAAIAGAPPLPQTWAAALPLLRPVLRPATFGQGQDLAKRTPVTRPALPYLAELVVMDTPESMAYVTANMLATWGVNADDMFAAARANLAEPAMRTLDGDKPAQPSLIQFVDNGDDYFGSLPLVDGWLAGMGAQLGVRPLVFIPDHNGLLLTGDATAKALNALLKLAADKYREAVRPLSPLPYTVNEDGDVVSYEVPEDHPAWLALRHNEVILAVNVYGHQAERLRTQYERDGIDVFVASLLSFRSPSGTDFTIATWTDGISSSLPQAHYVSFPGAGDDDSFYVPWQAVATELNLTAEDGTNPPRFRVEGWPDQEVMDRLRKLSELP